MAGDPGRRRARVDQRAPGGGVQRPPGRRRELVLDGLAQEVVAEHEPAVVVDEQTGPQQLVEGLEEIAGGPPARARRLLQRERAPQHRADTHQRRRFRAEAGGPGPEPAGEVGGAGAVGHLDAQLARPQRPVLAEHGDELGEEERVAAGAFGQAEEPRPGRAAHEVGHERPHVRPAQRAQPDPQRPGRRQRFHRLAGGALLGRGPCRRHQQQGNAGRARQPPQGQQRRLVHPVEVVDEDGQRPGGALVVDERARSRPRPGTGARGCCPPGRRRSGSRPTRVWRWPAAPDPSTSSRGRGR